MMCARVMFAGGSFSTTAMRCVVFNLTSLAARSPPLACAFWRVYVLKFTLCARECVCACLESNLNPASEASGLVFPMQQDRKRRALLNCVSPSEHCSTHSVSPIASSVCDRATGANMPFCVNTVHTVQQGPESQHLVPKQLVTNELIFIYQAKKTDVLCFELQNVRICCFWMVGYKKKPTA